MDHVNVQRGWERLKGTTQTRNVQMKRENAENKRLGIDPVETLSGPLKMNQDNRT